MVKAVSKPSRAAVSRVRVRRRFHERTEWTFVPPNGPPGMADPDFPVEPDGAAGKERSAQQVLRLLSVRLALDGATVRADLAV